MTTTQDLRAYLDAHGVDGAPTEPGWYLARTAWASVAVVAVERAAWGMAYGVGRERSGRYLLAVDIVRHAPLTLAPPAGRDLDAEAVAGAQAARDDFNKPTEEDGR